MMSGESKKMVLGPLGLIASLGVFFIDVGPTRLGLSIPKAIYLAGSTRSFVSIGFEIICGGLS